MNHRESWAEERKAPTAEEWARVLSGEDEKPRRRRETPVEAPAPEPAKSTEPPKVILRRKT